MQALVFEVAGERFAIPAKRVLTVVRRPETRAVPGAPAWIQGLFIWSSAWVPVLDLSLLIAGIACADGAASRVAVVEQVRGSERRAIGLLAPGMTRVADLSHTPMTEGLRSSSQPFLGAIARSDAYGVQLLDVDRVLPRDLDALLFGEAPT